MVCTVSLLRCNGDCHDHRFPKRDSNARMLASVDPLGIKAAFSITRCGVLARSDFGALRLLLAAASWPRDGMKESGKKPALRVLTFGVAWVMIASSCARM